MIAIPLSSFLQIGFGLAVLAGGAELLIRGLAAVARATGRPSPRLLSRLLAFAAYMPTLAIAVEATAAGSPDMALGGILGGGIACLLLLPGIAALASPLAPPSAIAGTLGAALLLGLFAMDGAISREEGLLLLVALGAYGAYSMRPETLPETTLTALSRIGEAKHCLLCGIAYLLLGLGLLMTGADVAVDGAAGLARRIGSTEAAIGLTLVAALASLYPLYAALASPLRRGKGVEANLFMHGAAFLLLGAAGLAATLTEILVPKRLLSFDLWLPSVLAALWLLLQWRKAHLGSREGLFLVALYGVYVLGRYLPAI